MAFGRRVLLPALAQHVARFPELQVDMELGDRAVDPAEDGLDAVIRFGELPDSASVARRLCEAGHDNVGTVLQSYLFRSEDDRAALLPLAPNLRIVKGAYLEPPELAYPRKPDVDAAYVRLLERMLAAAGHTAVATHDERLIDHTVAYASAHGVATDRFEFQMLYGVRPQLQLDLARRGYKVLVATPYGPELYPYLMRRLGERPANLLFFLKNTLRG